MSTALALLMVAGVHGQYAWPVDSLLTTWPVHQRIPDPKPKPRPAVLEASVAEVEELLRTSTPALPTFADSLVWRIAADYNGPRREHFRALLGMADLHGPMIERELARHGLPNELKFLPMALSAMNPQAASTTGEAGLWMLTWPVALRYGLVVNELVDERRDAEKCTRAAMRYLQDLEGRYGDWPTTVVAFACGPANVTRAVRRSGGATDARSLYPHMGDAHRLVLPRLMAFTYLAEQRGATAIEAMVFRTLEPSDTVRHDSTLHIDALTRVVGTRPSRFRALNPTLTGGTIPNGTAFLLPHSEANRFKQLADVVLEAQRPKPTGGTQPPSAVETVDRLADGREAILYRITTDDCINCIAERFAVGTDEIRTWNDLSDDALEVGNTLVLYVQPDARKRYEEETPGYSALRGDSLLAPVRADTVRTAPKRTEDFTWYTVRSGDSLYTIAKRYPGISSDDLMRYNKISANIRPGQRIKIPKR